MSPNSPEIDKQAEEVSRAFQAEEITEQAARQRLQGLGYTDKEAEIAIEAMRARDVIWEDGNGPLPADPPESETDRKAREIADAFVDLKIDESTAIRRLADLPGISVEDARYMIRTLDSVGPSSIID